MKRRDFIGKSLMAAAVAAFVPAIAFRQSHVLYGDNEHDDTKALQALLDGETVYTPTGEVVRRLDGGTYLLISTLDLRRNSTISNCSFRWRGKPQGIVMTAD